MENLELETQIINLGKLLVKELGLDPGVDTFSRWMAHYIAEKMIIAERLPLGKDKDDTEKECFDTILELWKHRWLLPSGKQPLEDFKPIFKVLERLNPENDDPFFYRFSNQDRLEIDNERSVNEGIDNCINKVIEIDKVARIWIENILHHAALKFKNEKTEILLKNAVDLSDNDDIQIIQLIFDNDLTIDFDSIDKQKQIDKLNKRIDELAKYSTINNFLLDNYKKQLLRVQDNLM